MNGVQWSALGNMALTPEERVAWGDAIVENVKKYRQIKGVDQRILAELVNKSVGWIGQMERKKMLPSRPMIPLLAAAIEMTVEELLTKGSWVKFQGKRPQQQAVPDANVKLRQNPVTPRDVATGNIPAKPKVVVPRQQELPKTTINESGPYLWQEKVTTGRNGVFVIPILTPDSKDGEVHLDLDDTKKLGALLLDKVGLIPSTQTEVMEVRKKVKAAIGNWVHTSKGDKMAKAVVDALEEWVADKHGLLYARTALVADLEKQLQKLKDNPPRDEAELSKTQELVEELKGKITTLQQVIDENNRTHQEELEKLHSKSVDSAKKWSEERLAEINRLNETWSDKVKELEAKLKEPPATFQPGLDPKVKDALNKRIAELTESLSTTQGMVFDRDKRITNQLKELENRHAANKELTEKLWKTEQLAENRLGQIEALVKQVSELERQLAELQAKPIAGQVVAPDSILEALASLKADTREILRNQDTGPAVALETLLHELDNLMEDEEVPGYKWRVAVNELIETARGGRDGFEETDGNGPKPFVPRQGR